MSDVIQTANRIVYAAGSDTADIYVYDNIGPTWAGLVGAKGFAEAVSKMLAVKLINVHINSPGGSVWEASAIYNVLKSHPAQIIVHIDGIALSAASYIAMAGDQIRMAENALMMIHNGIIETYGNVAELEKSVEMLKQFDATITSVYASRTGLPAAEISALMTAETWMSAAEAKAKGFATDVVPNKQLSASATVKNLDLAKFKNLSSQCRDVLLKFKEPPVSTATTNSTNPTNQTPPAAQPVNQQLAPLTQADVEKAVANALGVERTRVNAITALCKKYGHPEAATNFCGEGLTLDQVKDKLLDQLKADNVPVSDSVGNPGDNGKSADGKYKAEFNAQKAVFDQEGVTLEQYIKLRRSEDGV